LGDGAVMKGMQATTLVHIGGTVFILAFSILLVVFDGHFFGLLFYSIESMGRAIGSSSVVYITAKAFRNSFLLYWLGFNSTFCTCFGLGISKLILQLDQTELEYWRNFLGASFFISIHWKGQ